jgi:hypothetical protein
VKQANLYLFSDQEIEVPSGSRKKKRKDSERRVQSLFPLFPWQPVAALGSPWLPRKQTFFVFISAQRALTNPSQGSQFFFECGSTGLNLIQPFNLFDIETFRGFSRSFPLVAVP